MPTPPDLGEHAMFCFKYSLFIQIVKSYLVMEIIFFVVISFWTSQCARADMIKQQCQVVNRVN